MSEKFWQMQCCDRLMSSVLHQQLTLANVSVIVTSPKNMLPTLHQYCVQL